MKRYINHDIGKLNITLSVYKVDNLMQLTEAWFLQYLDETPCHKVTTIVKHHFGCL